MKPIATDTYSFERIITDNKMYVDKTAIIRRLVDRESGYKFFLSRPRRFGKSLLVSTLKELFAGRRDLFKGLAIDSMDYDWKTYPVIHLDMTLIKDVDAECMKGALVDYLKDMLKDIGVSGADSDKPAVLFKRLILANAAKSPNGKVVILIDEYDAPVAGFLDNPSQLRFARNLLHDFYVVLKAMDSSIHFLFMTGVSKFTKLSVFSGLNNLRDISLEPEYATLLGFTPEELRVNLREQVQVFADKEGLSFDAMVEELRAWYNGYRFSPDSEETVLNPVSVGMALWRRQFSNNWTSTGNATIIVERIRANGGLPADLNDVTAAKDDLDVCDAETLPMAALLYQSGYLTITDVLDRNLYRLGIPNREIRESLDRGYAARIYQKDGWGNLSASALLARKFLREGDTQAGFDALRALYAKVPADWQMKDEAEVKRYFLLFFSLCGADIITEAQAARGRADAVVTTADTIYVIEFKFGKTARTALAQIKRKGYAEPYVNEGKKIVCIGVNYNPKKRTIDKPAVEE